MEVVQHRGGRALLPDEDAVRTLVHTPALLALVHLGTATRKPRSNGVSRRVSEGTRTPDRLDHNQELYQLSYAHRGEDGPSLATIVCCQALLMWIRIDSPGSAQLADAASTRPTCSSPTSSPFGGELW
jgi:hypothetical protein